MEDQEQELYTTEARLAMVFNQKLGLGVALFQAGTNLFLNRYFFTSKRINTVKTQ